MAKYVSNYTSLNPGEYSLEDDCYKTCTRCKGDGYEDEYSDEPCSMCWGSGEILA